MPDVSKLAELARATTTPLGLAAVVFVVASAIALSLSPGLPKSYRAIVGGVALCGGLLIAVLALLPYVARAPSSSVQSNGNGNIVTNIGEQYVTYNDTNNDSHTNQRNITVYNYNVASPNAMSGNPTPFAAFSTSGLNPRRRVDAQEHPKLFNTPNPKHSMSTSREGDSNRDSAGEDSQQYAGVQGATDTISKGHSQHLRDEHVASPLAPLAGTDNLSVGGVGPGADCAPTTLSYNVDPAIPMTISASVLVHRASVADLQRALDPQHWDVCSHFWSPPPRTYLVTRSSTTVTRDPALPSDAPYHHSFYEHFTSHACRTALFWTRCHDADFENILDITSTPDANGYRADYAFLEPSVHATIDGVAVTLKLDDGYLAARPGPDPGTWIIDGKKTLLLEGALPNAWARIAFGAGLKELATEMADIACCDVPIDAAAQ